MAGIGITPEGLMQNYLIYDAFLENSYDVFSNRTSAQFNKDKWYWEKYFGSNSRIWSWFHLFKQLIGLIFKFITGLQISPDAVME